jgi:hypothetical protein
MMGTEKWLPVFLHRTKTVDNVFKQLMYNILKKIYRLLRLVKDLFV